MDLARFTERARRFLRDGAAATVNSAIVNERVLQSYAAFVAPGDLAFDVGANVGDRTAALRELGARVVAVEPQPACLARLDAQFGADPAVSIVRAAAAAEPGSYEIWLNESDTISSMSSEWMEAVKRSGRFGAAEWNRSVTVAGTTLDALIEEHGVPAFCKIDVEGFEPEVLAGLSRPIPAVSFEYVGEVPERSVRCVERLASLGPYEFVLSTGIERRGERWESAEEAIARLRSLPNQLDTGDVYARLRPNPA